MQIRKKLPIVLNVLICIPMLILALITYIYSAYYGVKKSENEIKKLAISEGNALETLVQFSKYQILDIANDERIIEYIQDEENTVLAQQAKQYIQESKMEAENYELIIINNQGQVILTSGGNIKENQTVNRACFQEILQGNVSFESLLDSKVEQDKSVNISVPVINKNQEVIGALCKVIETEAFSDLKRQAQVEETGLKYIFDNNFNILVHSNKEDSSILGDSAIINEVRETIDERKIVNEFRYDINHQKYYAVYYRVKNIGWTLCITRSILDMKKQAFIGAILIIVTIIVLLLLINIVIKKFIREITIPIDLLVETMNNVSAGDLGSFYTYEGDDEFGMLSKHYNNMLKNLGDSHRNLSEVYEELAATKQALENNYHALEKSKQELVISETRYRTALDAIDEVIWEYHIECGKFFATDNWSRIIGEELQEESITTTIKRFLGPALVESITLNTQRCISGEIRDFTQEVWIMKEGKKCWLLCKGHAIVGEDGEVEKLIGILTDITYNKTNEEHMRKLTYFDRLTGCLNRNTFIERMDVWLESDRDVKQAAVIYIDLDDFKKINDVLSHEVGDQVLNYVGKVLQDLLPPDTFIGRFGGDEFVIFKSTVEDMEEIHKIIYGILSIFQDKVEIDQLKVHLTCSMGIAMYPEDGADSAMLLKNADTAMHKVKESGKNSYSFYVKAMSQTLGRKLLVEEALREAVAKNSFYLQYQPIIDLESEKTVGCEALIRLYDSELGFISPGEFIPIAEETDLIIEAGDWVLENAMKALGKFNKQGYDQFTMNINVSSIQIREEDFLDKLVDVIKRIGVPPQCIKIEVTESVLMEDVEKSMELFNHVKAMGIKIALDDFGTGYSSLNYLRSIPLDILKIDKSFVDEITTSKVLSEIVDSIISMAHALDIKVVAEGVENEMQLEVLKKKNCDFIQGYYFGKPLSEKEFEVRLKKENHMKAD